MSKLGLKGNFAINERLQSVFAHYDLDLHCDGTDYVVSSAEEDFDLSTICPDHISREGNRFDLSSLKEFGEFLHQPTRKTLEELKATDDPAQTRLARYRRASERKANVHKARTDVHRLLRFGITGSVEIPPEQEERLDREIAECHEQTERAMRDADKWRSEIEFGNKQDGISAIPKTSVKPNEGFSIELEEEGGDHTGKYQRELDRRFWSTVEQATDGKYKNKPPQLSLSGEELKRFCEIAVESGELGELIDGVEFEEAVQAKLASVEGLKNKMAVASAVRSQIGCASEDSSISTLAKASSALHPVMSSAFMRNVWAQYSFTERHNSPFESLAKEYATLIAVSKYYLEKGATSADKEAIAHQFYSLIAFSSQFIEALEDGLEKEALANKARTEEIKGFQNELRALKDSFSEIYGESVSLSSEFLSDEQQDALKAVQNYAGKPSSTAQKIKNSVTAPIHAGGETFVDFTKDVFNFVREDPRVAAGFIALAGTLVAIKGGGDPNAAASALSSGLAFSNTGEMTKTAVNSVGIAEDLFGNSSYHWDLKFSPLTGYELYKHFANANFIVGPSQQFMEGIRSGVHTAYAFAGIEPNYDSVCNQVSDAVIEPLADQMFAVNMFQNFSHAAFWMWSYSKGYNHGLNGASQLLELSGPITNLSYRTGKKLSRTTKDNVLAPLSEIAQRSGIPVVDKFAISKSEPLSQQVFPLFQGQSMGPNICYEGDYAPQTREGLTASVMDAVDMREEILDSLPESLQDYKGAVWIDSLPGTRKFDGLKKEFTLGAHNVRATLKALERFDSFMENVASNIISEEKWHLDKAQLAINSVRQAITEYIQSGDVGALQNKIEENIEYVTAAEARYNGKTSNIYEALFDEVPDQQTLKRLRRFASAQAGKEKRAEKKDEWSKALLGEGEHPLKLTGHLGTHAKIFGTQLWGATLESARFLRRGTDRALNTRNVILVSAAATAAVGLDLAGTGNDVSNVMSGASCGTLATTATTVAFLNFNFWEDIVGVHLGTGASLLVTGAAAGYISRRYVKPLTKTFLETDQGQQAKKLVQTTMAPLGKGYEQIAQKATRANVELGQVWTARNRKGAGMNPEVEPMLG